MSIELYLGNVIEEGLRLPFTIRDEVAVRDATLRIYYGGVDLAPDLQTNDPTYQIDLLCAASLDLKRGNLDISLKLLRSEALSYIDYDQISGSHRFLRDAAYATILLSAPDEVRNAYLANFESQSKTDLNPPFEKEGLPLADYIDFTAFAAGVMEEYTTSMTKQTSVLGVERSANEDSIKEIVRDLGYKELSSLEAIHLRWKMGKPEYADKFRMEMVNLFEEVPYVPNRADFDLMSELLHERITLSLSEQAQDYADYTGSTYKVKPAKVGEGIPVIGVSEKEMARRADKKLIQDLKNYRNGVSASPDNIVYLPGFEQTN